MPSMLLVEDFIASEFISTESQLRDMVVGVTTKSFPIKIFPVILD